MCKLNQNIIKRFLTIIILAPIYFYMLYNVNFFTYTFIFVINYFILIQKEWYNLTKNLGECYRDLGMVIFTIPFVSLVMMRLLDKKYPCLYFLFIWSSDAFAMLGGMIFKGPKLTYISPNKTWSGLLCGVLGCFISMYSFFSLHMCLKYSILMCLTGQIGDIYISYYKRKSNIKDTGNILPGHGGLIDRFDSSILSAPIFWMMIQN
jgi:phosphatidate cytidylyltransferase